MIVTARTERDWLALAEFLRTYALVTPTQDMQCVGWVSEGKLVIVVGLQGFLGKVCQIHLAFAPGWHYSPRSMLREVFRHAFITAGREMLVGIVNSKNEKALRMDAHLGFRELYRLPGMHDDGGDLVLIGMTKDNCRYLDDKWRRGESDVQTVH